MTLSDCHLLMTGFNPNFQSVIHIKKDIVACSDEGAFSHIFFVLF